MLNEYYNNLGRLKEIIGEFVKNDGKIIELKSINDFNDNEFLDALKGIAGGKD